MKAKAKIDRQLLNDSVKNAASTFHNAGLASAKQSGIATLTMSVIMNIVSVIKGEKSPREAVTDTLKAGGAGAATGYVMGGGLAVLSQKLSYASNDLVRRAAGSNLPGQVITAVMVVGGTLKRYASGGTLHRGLHHGTRR